MLGLFGFLMGALAVWICFKLLSWGKEGEKQIEKIVNDRKIE